MSVAIEHYVSQTGTVRFSAGSTVWAICGAGWQCCDVWIEWQTAIQVIGAGSKRSQSADIAAAVAHWADYKERE